ncbi:hypothetical protein M422DRAFT_100377, partial [Sphaerobolus stellatus SS14]
MPAPGSSRAPKTFDGNEEDIAEFLEQFENCAEDCQLPDSDKVRFLCRYLGRQQKDIFRAFEGYDTCDWGVFLTAIKEEFEGAFTEKKYTRQSIIQFVRTRSITQITSDVELRTYHREFQAIARYLVKENIISEDERSQYFWFGLHALTRQAIEQRLAVTHPLHDRTKPYNHADVLIAGKYIFNIHAFYNNPPVGVDLDVKVQGKYAEVGIYDSGAELVCISEIAAKEMGLPFSCDLQLNMRDANGGERTTFGIIENLQLVIGGVSVYVHAWIIQNTPYRLLLGRPFQI